jgi:hypothetical protein
MHGKFQFGLKPAGLAGLGPTVKGEFVQVQCPPFPFVSGSGSRFAPMRNEPLLLSWMSVERTPYAKTGNGSTT